MSVKTIITLSLAFVLSVGVGLFGGNIILDDMRLKAQPVVFSDIIEEDFSDLKAPEDGKTPMDYDALYNFRYAKGKLRSATNVLMEGSGDVYSIFQEHQIVRSVKKLAGDEFYMFSSSVGTFAQVYLKTYYDMSDIVHTTKDYRNGTWGSYERMPLIGENSFVNMTGSKPQDFIPYIVNKDTVVESGGVVQTEDGKYRMKFTLDPETGANNYKRYVQDCSTSVITPIFSMLEITMTIDGDWNVCETFSEEIYTIKKNIGVLVQAECHAVATEVYKFGAAVIEDAERP